MNVDKEYDELREKRLDEWEHDLIEKEKELAEGVISAELLPDELAEKREELEEFEKILEEERDALEFEKNELAKAREESAAMSDKNGDELQELVARLEEDIGTLKKQNKELKAAIESNKGSAEMLKEPVEHSENIRVLQAQIAEQSAEMGEENRKLTGKLTKDKAEFDQKLMLRDETITDLSETMAEMKKKLKAKDDGAYVIALLDDMNTLRKQGRENLALKDGLEESNLRLKGKEDIISILQGDLMQLNKLNPGGAQAGDNTRFKELEAELERVKLELLAGGNKDEGQLNIEIQSLKESLKNYKRKLKQEQKDTENKLERKDEAIVFMQQEMVRMKKELDKELKKVKKDKKKAGKESDDDIDLKQRIEELEDEIEHWKRVNYELEDEVSLFKTEANVWKRKAGYNQGDSTDDDDISEGSQRSISQHSISSMRSATNDPLNSSIHSISSINQSDMFYVSDKTSAGNIVTASDEPTTPSQRLARSLANLWNKPAFSGPSRPAGLYGALDDE
jgi:chromosome segregation ATPase